MKKKFLLKSVVKIAIRMKNKELERKKTNYWYLSVKLSNCTSSTERCNKQSEDTTSIITTSMFEA